MSFSTLRCPNCGNAEQIRKQQLGEDTVYFCPSCNSEFLERLAKREYEKLHSAIKSDIGSMIDEAMLTKKLEEYYNLRQMLCKYITQEYIDSRAIAGICTEILKSFPNDFLANFFLTANTTSPKEVADAINEIDEKENEASMGLILDFMIKSLREEYITPIAALLDRCGKILSPEKKQGYFTEFEKEAKNVREGIYEVGLSRDVFLAYSSKDMPAVIKLLNFIESDEIGLSCFAAFRNLQHGRDAVKNYENALKEAMDNCSIFLFVSSVNSRNFNCDAVKIEMAYVRNSEMQRHAEYRNYALLPEKYRKLRIEYRLDNKPTPLVDSKVKEFFSGLTYAENHDQLLKRLCECMDAYTTAPMEESMHFDYTEHSNSDSVEDERFGIENGVLLYYTGNDETFVIPDGVTTIGDSAFSCAKYLKNVVIPNSVKRIENDAFAYCKNITTLVIPESVTKIGDAAFSGCTSLKTISVPNSVNDIGDRVFASCTALESVSLPESIANITENMFSGCTMLTDITIPNGVKCIGNSAFKNCSHIEHIVIPSGVTGIGENAFLGCKALKNIVLPSNLESIGARGFQSCSQLTDLTIPSNVKYVGSGAFAISNNLTVRVLDGTDTSKWETDWDILCNVEREEKAVETDSDFYIEKEIKKLISQNTVSLDDLDSKKRQKGIFGLFRKK